MRRFALVVLATMVMSIATSAGPFAAEGARPFVTAADVDLRKLLPPPPPIDSEQMRNELAEVVAIQEKRTPDAEARARADVDESVWRFADVMGPTFTNEALPTLSAFFDRVVATEAAVVDPAKAEWKRVRPFVASKRVRPCVAPSTSGSYPSGHTTVGTTMGIILSNMLPEKRDAIMARAWDYGWNRVVGGVHYRSDVEAGRIAGSLIFQAMAAREEFKDEFVAASAELRAVMGLAR